MHAKKILLVEDDADSASILEAYLRRDGFEVAIAEDGQKAVAVHAQWKPDLVLLDVMLPRLSGTEVLSTIRRSSDTPVIMVTAMGDEPEKLGALRYGADDYVVKPYSPKEVVARVFAVLRRAGPARASEEPLRHERLTVDTAAVRATVRDADGHEVALELTPTEFNILATLMKTPFKAFTRSELLEICLPDSDALERVVDAHVHNLRKKLEHEQVTGLLVTVRAIGYRFR
ncbi:MULTISPECIES: response regulator [Xanthomonas]|uniref:response regulator n=1 Tax=Xanthomonas TaxID=338 RepID=UPI000361535E|nr:MULTISPECIES: response regulator [Xanthomonas]MCW0375140.1 Transcriptional regulatory protein BaeR [Xanthomonas sacchari]MCW0405310.1 Transcriptional regulatory protein BaeR [Xanthomonas sacchari]MCW0417205.1 Transcriptional regulatory protein BaeR [Xanthomonas sacchari]